VFVADRARALDRAGARPEIKFMRLSSYGLATESSGDVHLLGDIQTDIAGRRVLLIDDIVDTGRSIACAAALLRQRKIGDLWTRVPSVRIGRPPISASLKRVRMAPICASRSATEPLGFTRQPPFSATVHGLTERENRPRESRVGLGEAPAHREDITHERLPKSLAYKSQASKGHAGVTCRLH
jgi:hypothetical protein